MQAGRNLCSARRLEVEEGAVAAHRVPPDGLGWCTGRRIHYSLNDAHVRLLLDLTRARLRHDQSGS